MFPTERRSEHGISRPIGWFMHRKELQQRVDVESVRILWTGDWVYWKSY